MVILSQGCAVLRSAHSGAHFTKVVKEPLIMMQLIRVPQNAAEYQNTIEVQAVSV